MKVFLSSVSRGLREERVFATSILRAVGHEVVRFEDFGATPSSSRAACLDALAVADVYVLILGRIYGDRMTDTGIAPTEEEFNFARASSKPILVFRQIGVEPDLDQQLFIQTVGDYATGRFWAEFASVNELGPALLEAVGTVHLTPPDVVWHPIEPVPYRPINGGGAGWPQRPTYSPVLETHVLPLGVIPLRPVSADASLVVDLINRLRAVHLVDAGAPIVEIHDDEGPHVQRPSSPQRDSYSSNGLTRDPYCGVRVARNGRICAYQALPSDTLGSITNQAELQARIATLLDLVAPWLPSESTQVALASCLCDDGRTLLGDTGNLGRRSSATLGHGIDAVPLASSAVSAEVVRSSGLQVSVELGARLTGELARRR